MSVDLARLGAMVRSALGENVDVSTEVAAV